MTPRKIYIDDLISLINTKFKPRVSPFDYDEFEMALRRLHTQIYSSGFSDAIKFCQENKVSGTFQKMKDLTEGMEIDLDAPLPPEEDND